MKYLLPIAHPGNRPGFFATAASDGGHFLITVLAVLLGMRLLVCVWLRFRGFERDRAVTVGTS